MSIVARDVQKATNPRKPPDALEILRIAGLAEPRLQRLFLRAVAEVRNGIVLTRVQDALAHGDIIEAFQAIPWERYGEPVLRDALPAELRAVYEDAAGAAGRRLSRTLGVSIRFDVTNQRAVDWIRLHSGELIQEFGRSSMDAVRNIMARSFRDGIDPRRTARLIKESGIGLTERYLLAVERYRMRLENLTDVDFTDAQIKSRADKYAARLLRLRTLNIARTETIRASNQGQLELWREAMEKGYLDHDSEIEWIAAHDRRVDQDCLDLDGLRVPFGSLFPGGVQGPPLHVACRCALSIHPNASA